MLDPILKTLLEKILKDAGPEVLRKRMEKGLPRVLDRMVDEDMTLEEGKRPYDVGRFALYWLWKGVVKNGPVADVFRDVQAEKVVNRAIAAIVQGTPTQGFVQRILHEAVEQTF